jgi:hypothetical protein
MPDYNVIIASDPDHEKVFAELRYGDKVIACVSQENGPDRLNVELPGPGLVEAYVLREVPLNDFICLLESGARKLLEQE